jgi:hypothetical protein
MATVDEIKTLAASEAASSAVILGGLTAVVSKLPVELNSEQRRLIRAARESYAAYHDQISELVTRF